ncbi:MAG TPA: hypothetical protein VI776_09490 [Anaerolineales bacterium]|jgi:hypothetical protein|nr:hypothetical protein [Anaerolineales bacterium]
MDIFFQDPSDIPLPPEEVRIRQLLAAPWPDNRRVRVVLEITPFQKRPNGEVRILDSLGEEVAALSIVEALDPNMEFTLHLRAPETAGRYTATAVIYYYEEQDPEPAQVDPGSDRPYHLPEGVHVVDSAEVTFEIEHLSEQA